MPVTTSHQFLEKYPFKATDEIMILGTIHPHVVALFLFDYYYGNIGSMWEILGKAFPNCKFNSLESILKLLRDKKVWVTDIIQQCDRVNANITRDADLYNIKLNDDYIRKAITNSKIHTIYFTSRFGKNNAAKLFTSTFQIDYKRTFNKQTNEFIIPAQHFGRTIKGVVLYSPSNDANIGIAGNCQDYRNKIQYYKSFSKPVKQFKIEFYRKKFQFFA